MRRYSNFFMNSFQLWESAYWSQGVSLFFKEYPNFLYSYFLEEYMRRSVPCICRYISSDICAIFFWLNEENFWLALWKNLYLYLSGNTSFKTLRIIFWYSWSFLFLDWSLGILSISFVVFALIFSWCLKGFMMTVNWITISFPYSLNLNETVCPLIGHLYHSGWTFRCWVLGCVV